MGTLTNLFTSLPLDTNIQSIAKGAIVLGAVGLDAYLRNRRTGV